MPKKTVKDRAYYEEIARAKGRMPALVKEPSTMAGMAALAGGMNEIFQVVEPDTAGVLIDAVTTIAVNPSPIGLAMAAFGLFSIFMKEKGGS
jgi:hypothetical protein